MKGAGHGPIFCFYQRFETGVSSYELIFINS